MTCIDAVREVENNIVQMTMDYVDRLSDADLDREAMLPWDDALSHKAR